MTLGSSGISFSLHRWSLCPMQCELGPSLLQSPVQKKVVSGCCLWPLVLGLQDVPPARSVVSSDLEQSHTRNLTWK